MASPPWYIWDNVLYRVPQRLKPVTTLIGGFDLIGTLIRSDRGKRYSATIDDWVWTSTLVPSFLNSLNDSNYTIAIFSNHKSKTDLAIVQARTEIVIHDLTFDPWIFIAFPKTKAQGPDVCSKPEIGMWMLFKQLTRLNGPDIVLSPQSFYTGDNADSVSPDPMYRQGDTDFVFAKNIGLRFFAPDQILPAQPSPTFLDHQELIIFVGQMGSGKSTHAEMLRAKNYVILNREMKNLDTRVRQELSAGRSLAVDATNPTIGDRAEFIAIGKELGIPTRIFWFTKPGRAYNALRTGKAKVPEIALNRYSARFERPTETEAPIVRVN